MSGITLTLAAAVLAVSPMVAAPMPVAKRPVAARAPRPAPAAISRMAFVARLDSGFHALDADHNGVVTAAELASAEVRARQSADAAMAGRRHDAFARLDTNHDGQLSPAEFDAAAAGVPRVAPDPAAMLAALDSDKNKQVSLTEYRARGLVRFDWADVNHDGIVTPEEDRANMKR
jgi:Ca2+-binding EF-hand superfamily protein